MLNPNILSIIDHSGDTEYSWNINNEDEIKIAKKTFKKFKAKRYIAYKTNKLGRKGEIINEFDPKAGKIIMVPPVVGG